MVDSILENWIRESKNTQVVGQSSKYETLLILVVFLQIGYFWYHLGLVILSNLFFKIQNTILRYPKNIVHSLQCEKLNKQNFITFLILSFLFEK